MAIQNGETRCLLELEGDVDISSSAELKDVMMAAIASRKELAIDLHLATDLDLTAVQLLWAARREAKDNGTVFALVKVPAIFSRVLQDMGMENFAAAADQAAAETLAVAPRPDTETNPDLSADAGAPLGADAE
jgi:anti-anti-sigma factor